MIDKIIQKWAPSYVKWTVFATLFFVPLFFSPLNSELFELPKMFAAYVAAIIVATSYLLYCFAKGKIEVSRNPLLIPFLALIASAFLSTIFSIDRFTSIFGYQTRLNGGLLSLLCYFALFVSITKFFTKFAVRKALLFLITGAFLVSVVGILGHFDRDPLCFALTGRLTSDCWQAEFRPTLRIFSTLGQPNWLATYLVGVIPVTLGFFLIAKKISEKLVFLLATITLFAAFLFTNSRSGLVGLAIALAIFIGLLGGKKFRSYRKSIGVILALLVIFTLVFGSLLFSRVQEFFDKNFFNPTKNVQMGGTESGALRLIVWRGALDIWKHYPILGSGTETFAYSYYQYRPVEHNQTTEWNFLYNKAHNEFLNYLANQGVVGLASYVWALSVIGTFGFKNKSKLTPVDAGLVSATLGIAASQFFGFSVVVTNLLTFILPAFLIVNVFKGTTFIITLPKNKIFKGVGLILVSGTGFYLLAATYGLFIADQAFERSRQYLALAALGPAQNRIETALTFSFPLQPQYLMTKATIKAEKATLESESGNVSLQEQAVSDTQKAVDLSPNNTGLQRQAATNYFTLSAANPKYIKDALMSAKKVVDLSPTDPSAYYNLYTILQADGKKDEATQALDKALNLKPDYARAIEAKTDETDVIKALE